MTKQKALDRLKDLLLVASTKTEVRVQDIILCATNDTYRATTEYIRERVDNSELPECIAERKPYLILNLDELQQIVNLLKEVDI